MRKLKYHVAVTLDGFIAHPDGSWAGFLEGGPHVDDFFAALADYGDVVMGRNTYDVGVKMGVTSPYPGMKQWVISRTMDRSPDDAVELVTGDAAELVARLKAEPGKDIWLCGGAALAGSLLGAGLIDEIILKLNPVVFGAGIPLLAGGVDLTALSLLDHKVYDNGVVLLRYATTA